MATFPSSYVAGAGLHSALSGGVNFNTNVFKVALFQSTIGSATPSKNTAHTYGSDPFIVNAGTAGEVSSVGYTAGGGTEGTLVDPTIAYANGAIAFYDGGLGGASRSWPGVTITTQGYVVYSSTVSNLIVCAVNFGQAKTAVSGTFMLMWPATGIFRITY